MNWLFVALAAYCLLAVSNLIDKFLVENVLGSARAYTFIACMMGALVLAVSPWFLSWPGWQNFFFNILLGVIFAAALLLLYASLRRGEASRALVIIGGSTPIFSLPLSLLILGDKFSAHQMVAIIFLVLGVMIIAFLPSRHLGFWDQIFNSLSLKQGYTLTGVFLALGSGLAYALFFVGSKLAYQSQPFLSVFLWTRLGAFIAALFILFSPRARKEIKKLFTRSPRRKRNQGLVVGNQILGSVGFILQNYAIYLGPVAVINALQGVQYAGIIVLGSVISLIAPKIMKENISWPALVQKGAAIILVSVGLYFLSL